MTGEVSNEEVRDLFAQWGEVKDVRDGKGKTVVYVSPFPPFQALRSIVVVKKNADCHSLLVDLRYSTKFVDFWDSRDAVKACAAADGIPFKGGRLEARFALQSTKYENRFCACDFFPFFVVFHSHFDVS